MSFVQLPIIYLVGLMTDIAQGKEIQAWIREKHFFLLLDFFTLTLEYLVSDMLSFQLSLSSDRARTVSMSQNVQDFWRSVSVCICLSGKVLQKGIWTWFKKSFIRSKVQYLNGGVAGAVLQTPLSLIHSFIHSFADPFPPNLQNTRRGSPVDNRPSTD